MPRPKIGLALGGGSARGWSHIGVIEAFEDTETPIDIVCGTSMGALVGAAYVCGALEKLAAFAHKLKWPQMARLFDINLAGGGVLEGERLHDFLRTLYGDRTIERLPKPFAAIATDFRTGREVQLKEGPLADAVRASIALPGLLKPFKIGERWLMDGGLVNPVPVSACRVLGADFVIAVNLNEFGQRRAPLRKAIHKRWPRLNPALAERLSRGVPAAVQRTFAGIAGRLIGGQAKGPGYFDVVVGAIDIMQQQITRARLAAEPADVNLAPAIAHIRLLEFDRASEAIAEGHHCAKRASPGITKAIAEF
jgi:NTE family protein